MRGKKQIYLLLGTNEDVQYQATLADLTTFQQQATIMSDSDYPQVKISVDMTSPSETFLVATYDIGWQ